MSIILKGIDMPNNGETLIVGIYGDGYVSVEHSKPLVLAIEPNAKAIQLPKDHGDIIDESKAVVIETIDGYYEITAPTILEAEE